MNVVIIKTNTCPKCRVIIPEFLNGLTPEQKDKVEIFTVGQNAEAMGYVEKYAIKQAPTFIIYSSRDGSTPKIFSGDVSVREILDCMSSTE